jgi:hypothetical protein
MKIIKPKNGKTGKKRWILPETMMTQEEFISGIMEAEKGPFSTVQESMEHFEKWLDQKEKK